jgi:hypothetical protein
MALSFEKKDPEPDPEPDMETDLEQDPETDPEPDSTKKDLDPVLNRKVLDLTRSATLSVNNAILFDYTEIPLYHYF